MNVPSHSATKPVPLGDKADELIGCINPAASAPRPATGYFFTVAIC